MLVIGLPILIAAIWGCFAVPNDPSRSGRAVIVIPGILRLLLETTIFSFGFYAAYRSGFTTFSWVFLGFVILHYLVSFDRVLWLLKQ